jgi:hypothetical protein
MCGGPLSLETILKSTTAVRRYMRKEATEGFDYTDLEALLPTIDPQVVQLPVERVDLRHRFKHLRSNLMLGIAVLVLASAFLLGAFLAEQTTTTATAAVTNGSTTQDKSRRDTPVKTALSGVGVGEKGQGAKAVGAARLVNTAAPNTIVFFDVNTGDDGSAVVRNPTSSTDDASAKPDAAPTPIPAPTATARPTTNQNPLPQAARAAYVIVPIVSPTPVVIVPLDAPAVVAAMP